MKTQISLTKYILVLVVILILPYLEKSCPISDSTRLVSEKDLGQILKKSDLIMGESLKQCFDLFLKKGYLESLEIYLNHLLKNQVKFKDALDSSITEYSKYLNDLNGKFKFRENEFQKVMPAIRWAQNDEYIFLEIKFSHRHDAPGCAEVEEDYFDITNGNTIIFGAYCVSGDVPIKFEASLKLFDNVHKLRSHWGIVSAGKFQATLRKVSEDWETLLSPSEEVPKNLQRWFEMEPKEEEISEEEEDYEAETEAETETKLVKKKSRKKKDYNPL